MKRVCGVYLPYAEKHYAETFTRLQLEGESFRYPVLTEAMSLHPRRGTAVDVGAHVGLWSKWLAREYAMVEAFEPFAEYRELFPLNVDGLNWTLHPYALGAEWKTVSMRCVDGGNSGHTVVWDGGKNDIVMRPLDSFQFDAVDLIKIDVEGLEKDVCVGAEKTLRQCKPIVVIEQRGLDRDLYARPMDEALHWLESLGMRIRDVVNHDWILNWS